jgi:ferredoxin
LSVIKAAVPAPIDFLSSEFNILDDLDDNRGNYRVFQSLDGVVTADMRHHAERKKIEPAVAAIPVVKDAEAAEAKGEEGMANSEVPPPLTITSKGRTLILAADLASGLDCGNHLNGRGLHCTICVPANGSSDCTLSRIGSLPVVEADFLSIKGSFGGFTANGAVNGEQANLATLLGEESVIFDLVLDLQDRFSFAGKQLPVGYYAPGDDGPPLTDVLAELTAMKGRFKRPQFTSLLANRCLHARSRTQTCLRCLEICPVEAIRSENKKIVIDHYLCQGCGGCALVCPADAIRLHSPAKPELLAAVAERLSGADAVNTASPDLILYDGEIDEDALPGLIGPPAGQVLPFAVEEIGRIGLDMLLSALVCGAGRVTLICSLHRPAKIRAALARQVRLARTILQGLRISGERIRLVVHPEEGSGRKNQAAADSVFPGPDVSPIPPAVFSFAHDARTLVRQAAQHLYQSSGIQQPAVPLAGDAPFGTVSIDAKTCTLCMACAGACPSGALVASGDVARLTLKESHCHQCGLCAAACPEDAVRLQPRLLCDIEAADTPVVLLEAEPCKCVECGEPFASLAMVERMQEKLSGHWMYGSERQRRRLLMCRTCRTRDALMAKDYL